MNSVRDRIASEVRQHGAIPFARFMELALYCPLCGYYEQEADNPGRRGDYYTSVSVGRLFGELLAFQFAEWLAEFGVPPSGGARSPNRLKAELQTGSPALHLVEAGAHDGKLACDILTWLREHRAGLFERLEYGIVEPSARRQEWQRRTLAEFGEKVRWVSSLVGLRADSRALPVTRHSSLVTPKVCGVFFSNELLDALPAHRLGWDAREKTWFEWGVALDGERFLWTRLEECPPQRSAPAPVDARTRLSALRDLTRDLLEVLPDGFTTEVCPAATDWWREAASVLRHGKLVTLDYGLTAEEFFAPHRRDGTLRAYRHHQLSGDVLANPGEQDLTAHVNFTAIQAVGEAAGLTTESFLTQAQFLVRIAEQTWRDKEGFGEWDAERLRQFKTLTHPEHLGRSFRVLVQGTTGSRGS